MKGLFIAVSLTVLVIVFTLIQSPFESQPFETLAIGRRSGIKTRKKLVITDQEQWEKLWQEHVTSGNLSPSPPQVNFADEMVIAVFAGVKTEGYILQITKVGKSEGRLITYYTLSGPSCSKCAVPGGLAQPFHIVKLKQVQLPVQFQKR